MRLRWTLQAADDLAAIKEFIERDSATYARQVIEQLYEAAAGLVAFPNVGREFRNEDRTTSAKSFVHPTASSTGVAPRSSRSLRFTTRHVCCRRSSSGALSDKRVKLAARCQRGRIAFVRPYASVERLITGGPGWAGRRSLRASR
jgi:plasmid stabilization system protein ParE